jgi:hypothetical protein
MSDMGSQDELTLARMLDGGFLVMSKSIQNMHTQFLFAATDIDVALDYIKGQIKPLAPQAQEKKVWL